MVFDKATNKIMWRNMDGVEGQVELSVIKDLFFRLQLDFQQGALSFELLHVHYVLTRIQNALPVVDISRYDYLETLKEAVLTVRNLSDLEALINGPHFDKYFKSYAELPQFIPDIAEQGTIIVDIISRMRPITKYAIKEKVEPELIAKCQMEGKLLAEIPDNHVEVASASIEEIVVKGHVETAIDMAANNPGVVGSTGIVLVVI
jgi:hypothetical protein